MILLRDRLLVTYLEAVQGRWKLLRSGWASSNLPPLVEIGLTGLPKFGRAINCPPCPPIYYAPAIRR